MANTLAPISEVGIASMAAGILDDYHITSLDEDTPICRFFAREFGYVRDEFTQLYPWHVALKRAALDAVATAPAFGWSRAYNLPADCIRLLPLRANGVLNGVVIPHELEDGQILADEGPSLKIRYIKRIADVSKWRPLMARAFAARMAMYAATRVTGKLQYYDKAQSEYQRAFTEATHTDSLERGTVERWDRDEDAISVRGTGAATWACTY